MVIKKGYFFYRNAGPESRKYEVELYRHFILKPFLVIPWRSISQKLIGGQSIVKALLLRAFDEIVIRFPPVFSSSSLGWLERGLL